MDLEETLGILEPLVSTTPNETSEISCIKINTIKRIIEVSEDPNIDFLQKLKEILPKLDVNLTEFTTHYANKVAQLFLKYKHIFDTTQTTYGAAKGVEHAIDLTINKPISQIQHRVSPSERQLIHEMTKEMLANQVKRPSTSPWASPVILVKKKYGKQRFCIDFRKINQITQRDVYPIPRIDDYLDALGGNAIFSTFDMHAGYWQIPMKEKINQKLL